MKVIMLDVDGVLNNHEFNTEAMSNSVSPNCVIELNKIIKETGAVFVLSTAWRYMIYGETMNFKGFEYLLRSHGVTDKFKIIGMTPKDEYCVHCNRFNCFYDEEKKKHVCTLCKKDGMTRAEEISLWLKDNAHLGIEKYVVIDDGEYAGTGHPFVKTDPDVGLTPNDTQKVINILNGL